MGLSSNQPNCGVSPCRGNCGFHQLNGKFTREKEIQLLRGLAIRNAGLTKIKMIDDFTKNKYGLTAQNWNLTKNIQEQLINKLD